MHYAPVLRAIFATPPPRRSRIRFAAALLVVTLLSGVARPAPPDEPPGSAVTTWTLLADTYGRGYANWRTLAIMHMAMHDALNAALPLYARWSPPDADEPSAHDAIPQVAMAAAARQVLLLLEPADSAQTEEVFRAQLARFPDSAERRAGIALGTAIGTAAVRRREDDGSSHVYLFPTSNEPGKWRPVPILFENSLTNSSRPYLFPSRADIPSRPPPALGSPTYLRDVAETRRVGGRVSTKRTPAETAAAYFWAYQSSQRGFMRLAADMLRLHPRPEGVFAEARIMSEMATAMADSAVVIWANKERYLAWRPVNEIQSGGFGVGADPNWWPLIETPPHPEYPSGHASDCYTGAGVLAAAFGADTGPITYHALGGVEPSYMPQPGTATPPSLQHGQHGMPGTIQRDFPNFATAAENCALSRIWAGAHLRSADDEAQRIAGIIVARAIAAVPPVAP